MSYAWILNAAVGDVAVITLNDEKSLNALSTQMVEELCDALRAASTSSRAIVLTGTGRAFSSGANLGSVTSEMADDYDAGRPLETHFNPLMTAIRALEIPFITAVNGLAAGVGSAIALSGDLIIAADTSYFLQAFCKVGVVPDGATAYLLTRAVGRARAMEMMLLGEKLSAQTALDWGLINRVTPKEQVLPTALGMARTLASGATKALGAIRQLGWHALDATFAEELARERVVQREMGQTSDHHEALAAFFAKRPPVFNGR